MELLVMFTCLGGGLGLTAIFAAVLLKQYIYVCRPSEILIFSGRERQLSDGTRVGYRVVHGGTSFRIPLFEKVDRYGGSGLSQHSLERRLGQADRLARAVRLDMVEVGWMPTVDNYLGRVTKPRILEAVREGAGDRAAQLIDHLKKDDMAKEAERLLADSGWLPEPLRLAEVEPATGPASEADGETEALPDFLASDDEASADSEDDPAHLVAAE